MEGRTIRRDFIYNAISMGLITGLYLLVTWISSQIFNVPAAVFIFLVVLAIVTHSLIDVARQTLDFLFFNRERREMRLNLNKIASSVAEQELEESLDLMLDTMCVSVRATYGLIIIFEELRLSNLASYQWRRSRLPVSRGDLAADDVQHVEPGKYPPPLEEAALLIPLYTITDQFGAILLGRPVNGIKYSPSDIELLLYPSDQVVDVIQDSWREGEFLSKITQFAETQQPAIDVPEGTVSVKIVEDALRNLFDYAHLGDTQLVKLKIVHQRLPSEAITHIDQGKAVNAILSEVIEKLRPSDQFPREPIPREWFPYYILHGAYLEDKLNRDIMSLLYISEGTFNRTRRAAIRSVTRMLEEMEAASS
jgi:hypothetical protein